MESLLCIASVIAMLTLLYWRRGYLAWTIGTALLIGAWCLNGASSPTLYQCCLGLYLLLAIVFGIKPIRRALITRTIKPIFASLLPRISETERAALEAGTIWWDADLFSGDPDWKKLIDFQVRGLSARERAFVDGPTKDLCKLIDDWQIAQRRDLTPEAWAFVKQHRFFGMIIPQKDGGLELSAAANSAVIAKLASRSLATAVTVMVPNSLGPGELLMHYGTEEQKRHYLPRLASGEEIPCFALTEPEAGSDAASVQSIGVVCRGPFNGKEVLGMRLQWDKRYTTLAPVATVLGMAFQLHDPEKLLGGETDVGITCALIPTNIPGVKIGEHHDPLGVPFHNGPNHGKDVFVPIDFIIGGAKMAGHGWRMLMDCLTVGRAISLPATALAEAQLATRVTSAYALVREQFNLPIGRFEGIETPLARIGSLTYVMNAARRLTLGAIDAGNKPAVLSALMKAYMTENLRGVINDAMDIQAGAGIMQGPRNTLARTYTSLPITITVEGANILTRSMIIFGQGAIRCHPFVQQEIKGVETNDVPLLDKALFGHINFFCSNLARSLVLGLSRGRLCLWGGGPAVSGRTRAYMRQVTHLSSTFAMLADVAMGALGGDLKRRERTCGRFADALAWLYFASATIKQFTDDKEPKSDLPIFRWAMEHALHQTQEGLRGVVDNFPIRPLSPLLRLLAFPTGAYHRAPHDRWTAAVADGMLHNAELRDRLTPDLFMPPATELGLGQLEEAWRQTLATLPLEHKLKEAVRSKRLPKLHGEELLQAALRENVISAEEKTRLEAARDLRREAVRVDSFDGQEYLRVRR